jgi:transcriptional regulator with XRE-family HTH domain
MSSIAKKPYRPKVRYDRNSIGSTVTKLRKMAQLTRDDLAARAQVQGWDISAYAIRRIEHGEREVTDIELRKLAKALRVPVINLLD